MIHHTISVYNHAIYKTNTFLPHSGALLVVSGTLSAISNQHQSTSFHLFPYDEHLVLVSPSFYKRTHPSILSFIHFYASLHILHPSILLSFIISNYRNHHFSRFHSRRIIHHSHTYFFHYQNVCHQRVRGTNLHLDIDIVGDLSRGGITIGDNRALGGNRSGSRGAAIQALADQIDQLRREALASIIGAEFSLACSKLQRSSSTYRDVLFSVRDYLAPMTSTNTSKDNIGELLTTERAEIELVHSSIQVISKADRLRLSASDKSKVPASFVKDTQQRIQGISVDTMRHPQLTTSPPFLNYISLSTKVHHQHRSPSRVLHFEVR